MTRGESVEVGGTDKDDPGWFWCRALDGREGWVPEELLSGQGARAVMLQDYSAKGLPRLAIGQERSR